MARLPCGLLLFSGPTGSGKTTLLYSVLAEVNRPSIKVLTIEDPVEYVLPGINQAQVSVKTGLDHATALRSFMRQDPDIIVVTDVREESTLHLCAEAALTGHMVMGVLPAQDSAAALDHVRRTLGEDTLVAATLTGIASQRLARRICDKCKVEYEPDRADPMLRGLGFAGEELAGRKLARGAGCDSCRGFGYRGRTVVIEVLSVSRELSTLIGAGAETSAVMGAARTAGFRSLREEGRRKVLEGLTTADEVFRVLAY
jgi:type IV pilus assembly protein PilB